MAIWNSWDYFEIKTIKQEPDASATTCISNFSDDMRENLDPQNYVYKEELDLKWDEKDNNYDKIYDNFDVNSIEESKAINDNKPTGVLHNRSEPSLINVKIENRNIEKAETNEHSNLQKYHYKEELDLDWDERDNNYDRNRETSIGTATDSNKADGTGTNTSDSRDKIESRKNIENPDTAKDCPKCKKRLKNLNTLNKHICSRKY